MLKTITAVDALTEALGHLNEISVRGPVDARHLLAACTMITDVITAVKREEAKANDTQKNPDGRN